MGSEFVNFRFQRGIAVKSGALRGLQKPVPASRARSCPRSFDHVRAAHLLKMTNQACMTQRRLGESFNRARLVGPCHGMPTTSTWRRSMPVRCHPCPRTPVNHVWRTNLADARGNDRSRLRTQKEMPSHQCKCICGAPCQDRKCAHHQSRSSLPVRSRKRCSRLSGAILSRTCWPERLIIF